MCNGLISYLSFIKHVTLNTGYSMARGFQCLTVIIISHHIYALIFKNEMINILPLVP